MGTHWRFFKPNSARWIKDNNQVKRTWWFASQLDVELNKLWKFSLNNDHFWFQTFLVFEFDIFHEVHYPWFSWSPWKKLVGEPIVLFKSEIFEFHVVMLLESPETYMKCKEQPKSVDKCHGWMIAKLRRLP